MYSTSLKAYYDAVMTQQKPQQAAPKGLTRADRVTFVYLGEKQRANTISPAEKRQRIKLAARDFAARFREEMKILARG